jgi:hypothetical protein
MTPTSPKPRRRAEILACLAAISAGLALASGASAATILRPGQTLKLAELTPEERAYYDNLVGGPRIQKAFLATRTYVRLCQEAVSGELPAIQLPDRPDGYDSKYLLPDEPVMLNRALVVQLIAKDCLGQAPACLQQHRGFVEMTPAQTLTRDQLDPTDQAVFDKMTDPRQRDEFLKTRSYVALCQDLKAHKLAAGTLPDEPLGFNTSYLRAGEQDMVDDAISANRLAIAERG